MSKQVSLPRNLVKIERFLPHVMAMVQGTNEIPSPSQAVVESYLRESAIQFASDTGVLKRRIVLDVQEGMSDYPLFPDCEETILRVRGVCVNGRQFMPSNPTCATCPWIFGPRSFSFLNDILKLNFDPCEDDRGALVVDVDVMPTHEACSIDEELFNRWRMAIVDGALMQLHMMPNKPWSGAGLSQNRERLFREAVSKARLSVATAKTGHGGMIQQSPFVSPRYY